MCWVRNSYHITTTQPPTSTNWTNDTYTGTTVGPIRECAQGQTLRYDPQTGPYCQRRRSRSLRRRLQQSETKEVTFFLSLLTVSAAESGYVKAMTSHTREEFFRQTLFTYAKTEIEKIAYQIHGVTVELEAVQNVATTQATQGEGSTEEQASVETVVENPVVQLEDTVIVRTVQLTNAPTEAPPATVAPVTQAATQAPPPAPTVAPQPVVGPVVRPPTPVVIPVTPTTSSTTSTTTGLVDNIPVVNVIDDIITTVLPQQDQLTTTKVAVTLLQQAVGIQSKNADGSEDDEDDQPWYLEPWFLIVILGVVLLMVAGLAGAIIYMVTQKPEEEAAAPAPAKTASDGPLSAKEEALLQKLKGKTEPAPVDPVDVEMAEAPVAEEKPAPAVRTSQRPSQRPSMARKSRPSATATAAGAGDSAEAGETRGRTSMRPSQRTSTAQRPSQSAGSRKSGTGSRKSGVSGTGRTSRVKATSTRGAGAGFASLD